MPLAAPLPEVDAHVWCDVDPASLVARPLTDLSEEEWDERAEAPARAFLTFLQSLPESSHVIVVLPHVVMEGASGLVATATGIEAVRLLAKSAARRWAAQGGRVNIVLGLPAAFGATLTDVGPDALRTASPLAIDAATAVVDAIRMLAGREARHLTGTTITADGGALMLP